MLLSTMMPELVIPPPQTSSPINPMVPKTIIGGTRPPFLPSFTLPPGGREYSYDMPTALMVDPQINASMYVDNAMVVAYSIIQYMASGSAVNNPGQMAQLHGRL